jgi:hypothetical protein
VSVYDLVFRLDIHDESVFGKLTLNVFRTGNIVGRGRKSKIVLDVVF